MAQTVTKYNDNVFTNSRCAQINLSTKSFNCYYHDITNCYSFSVYNTQ